VSLIRLILIRLILIRLILVRLILVRPAMIGLLAVATATGQIAILQIQVIEGEGTVHVPGVRNGHALSVAVTDEGGRPVLGAAVSFHLPENGPGGSFVNGLRTEIATTDARGRATVRAFQANRVSGRFQIRILASKEQARAGTVSFQYVGESHAGPGLSRGKWIAIAAVAGGGALAGVLVAGRSRPGPVAAVVPVVAPPVLTIGTPSISVGKP
jgi:hypothetical protein